MLTDAGVVASIKRWQSQLTGLPEQAFEGQTFEEQLERMQQWHVSKVVAEQMAMLTTAQLMLEHGITKRDLGTYIRSKEWKTSHLGTWSFLTGVAGIPVAVDKRYIPLLRSGGYRPFLPISLADEIARLCTDPKLAKAELSPGGVADAIYHQDLSTRKALDTLRLVRTLAQTNEELAVCVIRDLVGVRKLAEDVVVGLPEIEQKIESASPELSSTPDTPPDES